MKNEKKFTLRLSPKQLEKLREIADREKQTPSAVIRILIDDIETEVHNQVCTASQENGL